FFSSRRRHTRFSRDWSSDVCSSDLPGRVGQIHNMFVKTHLFGPVRFATGTQMKMAFFRAHHAAVALCQRGKARVTIALRKTGFGAPATGTAMNGALVIQLYRLPQ